RLLGGGRTAARGRFVVPTEREQQDRRDGEHDDPQRGQQQRLTGPAGRRACGGRGRTRRGRLRRRCPVALPRRRSGLTATAVVGHGRRDRGRGERRGGRRRAGGERAEPFARLAHGGPFVRVGPQQAHEQRGGLPGVLRRVDLPVGRRVEQGELVGVVAVRRQALDRVVQ